MGYTKWTLIMDSGEFYNTILFSVLQVFVLIKIKVNLLID